MQVFAFLSVTTTNVLATNSPQAPGISDKERKHRLGVSETMLAYTLCVALMMGLCIVLCLEAFGPWLLALIGSNDDILGPASQYLRIRATASPAVTLVMVAQGACFGQQVGTSPLLVATIKSSSMPVDAVTCHCFTTSSSRYDYVHHQCVCTSPQVETKRICPVHHAYS